MLRFKKKATLVDTNEIRIRLYDLLKAGNKLRGLCKRAVFAAWQKETFPESTLAISSLWIVPVVFFLSAWRCHGAVCIHEYFRDEQVRNGGFSPAGFGLS